MQKDNIVINLEMNTEAAEKALDNLVQHFDVLLEKAEQLRTALDAMDDSFAKQAITALLEGFLAGLNDNQK